MKKSVWLTLTVLAGLAGGLVASTLWMDMAPGARVFAQCPPTFTRTTILTPSDVKRLTGRNTFASPTTITMAPDGRLFVGQQNGLIHIFTLDAGRRVTNVKLVENINSRDRDKGRLVTGMTFGPNGSMDLYVPHSEGLLDDPTISVYSGVITKLLPPDYIYGADVVPQLPRSKHDHAPNGVVFGPDGMMYVAVGGNTNNGAPHPRTQNTPEMVHGAAILKINPATGQIFDYATGFRNAYDMVWHSNGYLYATDNAPNEGWGLTPGSSEGCPGLTPFDPGTPNDKINRIDFVPGVTGKYYGHPNPRRNECIYEGGPNYVPPVYRPDRSMGISINGITEWKGPDALGDCLGNLLTVSFGSNTLLRLPVNPDGTIDSDGSGVMASDFAIPLDVIVDPTDGAIFVSEWAAIDPDPDNPNLGAITILVPQTTP